MGLIQAFKTERRNLLLSYWIEKTGEEFNIHEVFTAMCFKDLSTISKKIPFLCTDNIFRLKRKAGWKKCAIYMNNNEIN